ncbi:MAG: hemolysin family protein [Acidimicrobiia bacterium]|nr:hemolysin family protein [Acidimicrobiia bacterium]
MSPLDDPPHTGVVLAVTSAHVTAIVIALLLLVFAAACAAAESVITRASRSRTEELVAEGSRSARRLQRRLDDLAATRASLSLAGIVAVVAAVFAVGATVDNLALLPRIGVGIAVVLVAFTLQRVAVGLVSRSAESGAGVAATIASPIVFVLRPVAATINTAVGVVLRSRPDDDSPASERELREIIDRAGGDVIEQDEAKLLNSVFHFGDTVVREVMRPRPDMFCLAAGDTVGHALDAAAEEGYSRIPVHGDGGLDDIHGLLYVKDLLARDVDRDLKVGDVAREAHFVPEQKRSAELLAEMQRDKFHLAIVIDEYGGTAGLVTLEDLLEELVGEIADEYDPEEHLFERVPGGFLVAGRLSLSDLGGLVGFEVDVEDADTVGGAMLSLLGRIPRVGEEVTTGCGRLVLRARRIEGHRVDEVEVLLVDRSGDDGTADAGGGGIAAATGSGHDAATGEDAQVHGDATGERRGR